MDEQSINPAILSPDQRVDLLRATYDSLPMSPKGLFLHGGDEAGIMWFAVVDTFKSGTWPATILCAQAICERTLAGIVSLVPEGTDTSPPDGWEKWALGSLVNFARGHEMLPPDLLEEIEFVRDVRLPWVHWRSPHGPDSLSRKVLEAVDSDGEVVSIDAARERILSQQALRSARAALVLYFGDFGPGIWTMR